MSTSWPTIPRRRQDLIILALVLALTTALYSGSFPKEFTNWDDPKYITENPLIQSFSLENFNRIVTEPYFSNYAPVTLLSYVLDYQIWKLNANGFHVTNVLLHLACIGLLFSLLKQLGASQGIVLMTVTLFAIHPVNVESVSWASERKNLLATLFFLLSFQRYIRFKQSSSRVYYLGSLLFFLLSILSKASTIVAPLVYLAFDYCLEGKRLKDLQLYEKLPFLAASEILTLFTIHAADVGHSLRSYHLGGPILSALGIGQLSWDYLRLLFFPTNLNAIYRPGPPPSLGAPLLWLSLVIIVFLLVVLGKVSRKLLFGLLFFVIFLIPVLNVVPLPVRMADRYLYIPQIGIWGLVSALTLRAYSHLAHVKWTRLLFATGIMAIGSILSCLKYVGARTWRNSYTLWTDVINKDYQVEMAHCNLGYWLVSQKQFQRAGLEYQIAFRLNPRLGFAAIGMGGYYFHNGRFELAERYFEAACNLMPDYDFPVETLGDVLAAEGRLLRALFMYQRASYLNPGNVNVLNSMVTVCLKLQQPEAAEAVAQSMIRKYPGRPDGYLRQGQVLEARGDFAGALRVWEEGRTRIAPNNTALGEFDQKLMALRKKLGNPP
jgi:protein O-mannosyl-transferase